MLERPRDEERGIESAVVLTCHMALDMPGNDWALVACRCQKALCHSKKSLSLTVDGLRQKRRGLW